MKWGHVVSFFWLSLVVVLDLGRAESFLPFLRMSPASQLSQKRFIGFGFELLYRFTFGFKKKKKKIF